MRLLLRLALRPWILSPWSQIGGTLTQGVFFFFIALLFFFDQKLIPVIRDLREEQNVTIFLKSPDPQVVDRIRVELGSKAEVFETVDSAGFLAKLKEKSQELVAELEGMSEEYAALIPHFVSVKGQLSDEDLTSVRGIAGVESVESSKDRNQSMVEALGAFRVGIHWMMAVLAFGLFFTCSQMIRLQRQIQADALQILNLWGASSMELQIPALMSNALMFLLSFWITVLAWSFGAMPLWMGLRQWVPALRHL